ncbi:hypothetical protein P8452_15586 [Trifolium repens]|nr:hypothetical protein P8452_15586 [Trifolium repens]
MINKFQGEHVDGDDDSPSIPASHHNVASNGNTCKWITTSSQQILPLVAPSFILKATAREMHVQVGNSLMELNMISTEEQGPYGSMD